MRHEIEEEKAKDDRDEEAIKQEIREVAEKLLSINQQIQDHLMKYADL